MNLQESEDIDTLKSISIEGKPRRVVPQQQLHHPHLSSTSENIWSAVTRSKKIQNAMHSKFDEEFQDQGLLSSVDPENVDEIRRLLSLVDRTLHHAVEEQDLATMRFLLDAGASPAALDWKGMTPLHLCIVKKYIKPFEILLSYKGSVDVKDASGLSVLPVAILHRWLEGVTAALAAGADEAAANPSYVPKAVIEHRYERIMLMAFGARFFEETSAHLAVKSGDMKILEEVLTKAERNGTIDCLNRRGVSPLYTAIEIGNLEAVQALVRRGASVNMVSDRNDTALHVAVHQLDILRYLLDNTDVVNYQDDFGSDPIHIAVSCNKMDSVQLLLDKSHILKRNEAKHRNKIRKRFLGTKSMQFNKFMRPIHHPPKNCPKFLSFILCLSEPLGFWIQRCSSINARFQSHEPPLMQMDDNGYTPLHIAAKQRNVAMMALLLRKGAKLLTKGPKGRSALEIIATEFYNPSECFELIFDEFINTHQVLSDTVVNVDYRALTDVNGVSQIKVIEELVRCGQKKILVHPLIESLLYLKWKHLLPVFYVMIGVYVTFLITLNIFVINVVYYRDINNSSFYTSPESNSETALFEIFDGRYWMMLTVIYTSIFLLILQESFYIHLKRLYYFVHLESWLKLWCLALGVLVPAAVSCAPPLASWPRHAAAAALLLGWLQAMLLLSRFPTWGHYALILGKVATNIFKILMTSICLVIGFSFCFMIQYHSAPPFDGPFSAFVKTLVMMSSEFDYEDLFNEAHDKDLQDARTIVRLCFVMFVIFVAIVLMNFMIGVAVSDISNLHVIGNIRRLEKQVELLSSLDVLVNEGIFAKMYKKKFGDRKYHQKISNFIGFQTKWRADLKNRDGNNYYHLELPSSLHSSIVEIAWRKKQRNENNYTNSTNKYKLTALYHAVVDSSSLNECGSEKKEIVFKAAQQMKSKLEEQIKSLAVSLLAINNKVNELNKISSDIANMKVMLTKFASNKIQGRISNNTSQSNDIVSRMRSFSQ